MTPAFALALVLALALPSTALAGTCGSDGGSSSNDSLDTSSLSDDSSSSSTPACTDETDIVGYRRCVKFGAWGSPRRVPLLVIELGTAMRTFSSPLGTATGELSHEDERFTYRVVSAPPSAAVPAMDAALVSTLRLGLGLPHGLYAAAEGELGGLVRNSTRAEMTSTGTFGAPTLTPGASLVAGALGIVGARGAAGRGTFGVEVAGGVRAISYTYDSRYLACEGSTTQSVRSPLLEARARASLWLSPFVNLGVTAGASIIDRGAWIAGAHLGFVTQAFGGLLD